jgi:hypothetical protein
VNSLLRYVPLPALILEILSRADVPLPTAAIVDELRKRYKRDIDSARIASTIAYYRRTYRRRKNMCFPCAVLHPDGARWRGWVARADWPLANRIIPDDGQVEAAERAEAAAFGHVAPPWSLTQAAIIDAAAKRLRSAVLVERFFGT